MYMYTLPNNGFRLFYDQMVSLVLMSAQYTFLLDTVE